MKSSTRQQLLEVLGEISRECPQIRLGQLMANLSYMARGISADSLGNVEDTELLDAARTHLDQLRRANGRAPNTAKSVSAG